MGSKKKRGTAAKRKKRVLRVWSREELKILRRNAGAGVKALSRALKRTEHAVRLKASQLRISLRRG